MHAAVKKGLITHLIALIALIVINALYFVPQFQGKVPKQSDIISFEAAYNEIKDYKAQKGEDLLWTDAMFGGMPTYQISTGLQGQYIKFVQKFLSFSFDWPVGLFLPMMIAFYAMLVIMGVHPWLAIFGAIAFGFNTNNFVLFEAGHSSKLSTLIYLSLITGSIYLLFYKKRYLIGGTLLALATAGNLAANHIQMTYYYFLCLLVLGFIWLWEMVKSKSWKPLFNTVGMLVFAAVIGVAAVVSNLWPTYEYAEDTMRGKPILKATEKVDSGSSSTTDGLAWDYAMQWSNNWQDVLAGLVPRVVGGSSGEKVKEGVTYNAFRANPASLLPDGSVQLPLYWGELPFTSGPSYFGAVICFLFVFGLFFLKNSMKWWIGISVLLTILLSLGKNLEGFQRFLFDYLPMYNKFRAPSSAMTITGFFMPLLAILGISQIVKEQFNQKEAMRALGLSAGITGGLTLFFALFGSGFFNFSNAGDAGYQVELVNLLKQDRADFLRQDAWRSFFFIAVAAGLIWAYLQRWIQPVFLIFSIGLLSTIDLWSVGRRYLGPTNFVPKSNYSAQFQARPVDQQILNIESRRGDYRVLDLSANTFNSSAVSYFHNSIGGYSAAKLQRYQDLIEFHIAKGNEKVLDMLNAKYVITQDQQLRVRSSALGPAWLVESVLPVGSANEEIEALSTFDPANQAVVLEKEFKGYTNGFDPKKGGTIRLTTYDPQHMVYEANLPSEQLAVFSEIWYGPDKGWKAKIDGKEVPHIRANYVLRALRIPGGNHKVEFVFEPRSIIMGRLISAIASLIAILGFLVVAGVLFWKWYKNPVLPQGLLLFTQTAAPIKAGQTAKAKSPQPAAKRPKPGNK